MVNHANEAALVDWWLDRRTGRARLEYRIDGWPHTIHAVFHDAPVLDADTWALCLEDLALAGLLDVGTASLSRRVTASGLASADGVLSWMRPAAHALRVECLAELSLPLSHLRLDFTLRGGAGKPIVARAPKPDRVLLLMGGGKDSLYSYELLRAAGLDVECFYMTEACRTWQQLRRTRDRLAGEAVQHRAYLDANQMGRLETRFGRDYPTQFQVGQALFLSVPYALARGCAHIAIGAERSANERTGTYRDVAVSHQYEKSAAYFARLNRYFARRYGGAIRVWSPLHGLFDLGIYGRFLAGSPRLIDLQSSCGGANSYRRHCGRCEKCAFVAALFTALSSDRDAFRALFPLDPLDDVSLFDEWYHGRFERPRACVGSLRELRVALRLGRARGWKTSIHAYDRDRARAPGPAALSHYLGVHHNASMPDAMRERVEPWLALDPGPLADLFASAR
jgi:hypothetical protein